LADVGTQDEKERMRPPGPLEIGIIIVIAVLISVLLISLFAVFLLKIIRQAIRNQAREEMTRFQQEMEGPSKKQERIN
jgi:hypothetical protein